jgi:acyl-coenzyme A synthetase/AMP-(fatty) acid ligase
LASTNPGWHRTGDVGHLDPDGSLWIEGRLAHVIVTPTGVLTPVGPEQRAITLPFVEQAALVGVGPPGITTPVLVVVITPTTRRRTRSHLLDADRTEQLRQATGVVLAAVLVRRDMPVDIRHNSKIDRSLLAAWAERVLAGAGG